MELSKKSLSACTCLRKMQIELFLVKQLFCFATACYAKIPCTQVCLINNSACSCTRAQFLLPIILAVQIDQMIQMRDGFMNLGGSHYILRGAKSVDSVQQIILPKRNADRVSVHQDFCKHIFKICAKRISFMEERVDILSLTHPL